MEWKLDVIRGRLRGGKESWGKANKGRKKEKKNREKVKKDWQVRKGAAES